MTNVIRCVILPYYGNTFGILFLQFGELCKVFDELCQINDELMSYVKFFLEPSHSYVK